MDSGAKLLRERVVAPHSTFVQRPPQEQYRSATTLAINGHPVDNTGESDVTDVLNAWLAAGVEFVGGLALLLGFGVRVLGLPLVITMLVAAFTAHSGFSAQSGGMEYPLTLAALTATLTLTGPGHFSLATLLFGSTPSELSSSESSSGNRHEPALVT